MPDTFKWKAAHNAFDLFDLRLGTKQGLGFLGKTINNATIFFIDSMQADCLVIVVKRNLNDTEAEILYEIEQPEQRERDSSRGV